MSCGIPWTLSTSSTLRPQGESNYRPENMDDGDRKTAWVEGVNGYGIGEKVIIKFQDPNGTMKIPFRGFRITNGYAKNIETWKSNSRVKLLELSLQQETSIF